MLPFIFLDTELNANIYGRLMEQHAERQATNNMERVATFLPSLSSFPPSCAGQAREDPSLIGEQKDDEVEEQKKPGEGGTGNTKNVSKGN